MPYTTIPTLADGQILTASHLNLLGGNANYLAALGSVPNTGFVIWYTTNGSGRNYKMRHRHRYLKFYYESSGNCDFVKLYVGGVLRINSDPPQASVTLTFDMNTTTIAVGDWYDVGIDVGFNGAGSFTGHLLWEQTWT